jgi:Tfp pilus assembly protein PilV
MTYRAYKKISERGFSLFETLVAIFILMVAVAGAMSLTQKSLTSSAYSKDQVIASFLAQDAIEYIRNIRDYNYNRAQKNEDPAILWNDNLLPCWNPYHCTVDTKKDYTVDNTALTTCPTCNVSPYSAAQLYYNATDGSYSPSASNGTVSRFYRDVQIAVTNANGDAPAYASIIVEISWRTGSFDRRSVVVTEHLYDWGSYGLSAGIMAEEGGGGEDEKGEEGGEAAEEEEAFGAEN